MGRWGKWFSFLVQAPKDEETTKKWSQWSVHAIRYRGQLVDVYTNTCIIRGVPPQVVRGLFGDQGIYILSRNDKSARVGGFALTCEERAAILSNANSMDSKEG